MMKAETDKRVDFEEDASIMEDGDWKLRHYESKQRHTYSYYYLQHKCTSAHHHWGIQNDFRYHWYQFRNPCTACRSMIPESLQAAYVLLTGDMRTPYGWSK